MSRSCLERVCRLEGYLLTNTELQLAALIDLSVLDSLAAQLDPGLLRASRMSIDKEKRCAGCCNQQQCPLMAAQLDEQQRLVDEEDNQ